MIAAELVREAHAAACLAIAEARGIKLTRTANERIGPCPKCGGTDRFGINIRKNIWNCRQCVAGGDVIALVQHLDGVSFAQAVETITGKRTSDPSRARPHVASKPKADHNSEAERIRKACFLWSKRQPIAGSPAERYLREARGYTGPLPATLAYLPPRRSDQHPAMIAPFGLPSEPEPGRLAIADEAVMAVHLTLLRPDGSGKAPIEHPKLTPGVPKGRPIVIAPMNDLLGLAITEGLEDALSIHIATGLGAWAAGSAPLMPHLANAVPDYTDCITISVDDNEPGRANANELAARLRKRGLHVEPIIIGKLG